MDFATLNGTKNASSFDYTVINVGTLPTEPSDVGLCYFRLAELPAGVTWKNALFVVNVSIDMNGKGDPNYGDQIFDNCSETMVTIFDNFNGTLNNITVVGTINFTNSNLTKNMFLGKMFG